MLNTERKRLTALVGDLARERHGSRRALIPILQRLQSEQGHVPVHALQAVAGALDLHPAEVYGALTFYDMFEQERRGHFVVRLCRTVSCEMQGKDAVARQLQNDLGIDDGETTADGMFSFEWCNCMGMCDQGPALLVNHRIYTSVTPDRVSAIIDECLCSLRDPARKLGEEAP